VSREFRNGQLVTVIDPKSPVNDYTGRIVAKKRGVELYFVRFSSEGGSAKIWIDGANLVGVDR
jgi:hypothetical protein